MRSYTVKEIMLMRVYVRQIHYWYGPYSPQGQREQAIAVEALLQTYMVGGVDPEDLAKQAEETKHLFAREHDAALNERKNDR